MIEHINFVERELFVPSYRRLAYLAGAVIGGLLALYAVAFVRVVLVEKESQKLLQEVTDLKAQREKVLAEFQKGRGGAVPMDEVVRKSLQVAPKWSDILNEMTRRVPPGVWLISFKTYDKDQAAGSRGAILIGEAEDPQQISIFLKELVTSKSFEKPQLTTSKQESRGGRDIFTFTIDSGIRTSMGGGGA